MKRFKYDYVSLNLLIMEHDIDRVRLLQKLLKNLDSDNRKAVQQLKIAGLLFYRGNVDQYRVTNLEIKNIIHMVNFGLSAVLGLIKYGNGLDMSKDEDAKNRAQYYLYEYKMQIVRSFFFNTLMSKKEFKDKRRHYSHLIHQFRNHDYGFIQL